MRRAALLLTCVVACQRTPEEPAPATTATVAPLAGEAPNVAATFNPTPPPEAAGARCIRATPKTAPPAQPRGPAPGCPPDPERPPKLPAVTLAFPDAAHATLTAELTRTDEEHARGLMYRKALADDRGMLFRMGERREHSFWMHNTCISLDMLFIDDDGTIVGIVENAPTLNDSPQSSGCPSSWVLEVNAGWTRKHGVVAGQRMTIPDEARR